MGKQPCANIDCTDPEEDANADDGEGDIVEILENPVHFISPSDIYDRPFQFYMR